MINMTQMVYEEGHMAFHAGRDYEDNPYTDYEDPSFKNDWNDGFSDAEQGFDFYKDKKNED